MTTAVRYVTRGGNTKKLADAIAAEAGVEAKDCSVPLTGPVDLLFLGGSVYWGGIDKKLKQFIDQLDPAMVKCVATFGTAALKKEPDREIEQRLQARGIPVASHSFHCRGEFAAVHRGHPDSRDLQQAAAFAKTALDAMK